MTLVVSSGPKVTLNAKKAGTFIKLFIFALVHYILYKFRRDLSFIFTPSAPAVGSCLSTFEEQLEGAKTVYV